MLGDASGNGHDGTIQGASWVSGHDGGALSFDGSAASVDLGSLGTFYQSGFTLEAWVKKSTGKKDVAVLGSWTGSGGPMLWVDHLAGDYQLTMNSGMSNYLDSGQAPAAGQWQHLAATYDGSTARFYVDGTQVASRSVGYPIGSSNAWRIGAYGSPAGGFFDGLVDDVRIYNRSLSAAEVQTDMNLPVPPPGQDAAPPTAPGSLTATVGTNGATLHWSPATDNRGVTHYNVYRGHDLGLHTHRGQPDRTANGDQLRRHGHRGRRLLLQGHRGRRGRQRRSVLEPGECGSRHDAALRPGHAHRRGRSEQSRPELGRRHG